VLEAAMHTYLRAVAGRAVREPEQGLLARHAADLGALLAAIDELADRVATA
jgi:hypothetical protein